MPFTINPDGTIRVDTPDELLEVLRVRERLHENPITSAALTSSRHPSSEQNTPMMRPSVEPMDLTGAYRALYDQAVDQPLQQKMLRLMLKFQRPLRDEELRIGTGVRSNIELRGLMIGIVRRAKNRNLPPLFSKTVQRVDGGRKRVYTYLVNPEFRAAMDGYELNEPQEKMAV